ncbi:NAD(P)-binding domain-containing protein [Alicyclobacillus cycloheptanicus]|uniref:Competence protein ComER n=1 Tax=Alicyclobacillus cycloheptanicus TaxID=1457 RepID=A0ABT9XH82_9BACL|nr:NAD(P)-binding domain-containing protein [Alicyclobacillus cycloheptanicus]MDQ0189668.1 competence protein ComER [Alicyclobacillus cycloheptanicus]WDL99967.1 NAD(P)-binding domain-containing protein [Alicyclobacillus cycloheptanicus]
MALRIGIIGTGNIGGMLAKAWASAGQAEVFVYNRTPQKARDLAREEPRIHLAASAQDVVRFADVVVVSTKASDGRELMAAIGDQLAPSQIVATTISTIPLQEVETWTRARVVKIIPSIVQTARCGILLVSYGSRFDTARQECFEALLSQISVPFAVNESQLRVCSDMTSCGPAFLAGLLRAWAEAASETGHISCAEAEYLLTKTFISTGALLSSGLTIGDILHKVTVPGGVTAAGLRIVDATAPAVFKRLHEETERHSDHGSAQPLVTGQET